MIMKRHRSALASRCCECSLCIDAYWHAVMSAACCMMLAQRCAATHSNHNVLTHACSTCKVVFSGATACAATCDNRLFKRLSCNTLSCNSAGLHWEYNEYLVLPSSCHGVRCRSVWHITSASVQSFSAGPKMPAPFSQVTEQTKSGTGYVDPDVLGKELEVPHASTNSCPSWPRSCGGTAAALQARCFLDGSCCSRNSSQRLWTRTGLVSSISPTFKLF